MERRQAGVRVRQSEGVGRHAVLGFRLEYGEECPLWYSTGLADLDQLQLPDDLTRRLRRFTTYWNSHGSWDKDWPEGHPEAWWAEEQTRLPRDVASALGRECAVATNGGYLHSPAPPAAPTAADHLLAYARKWDNIDAAAQRDPGSFRFSAY